MYKNILRVFSVFIIMVAWVTSSHANNVSLDSDTYIYDSSTNQITVRVSYDFVGLPMFGGGMGLMYDPNALTFVSYTRDLTGTQGEEGASPIGSLISPGFYSAFGIGTFTFQTGITDAATFGTFVFDVNQPTCTTCFVLSPEPTNPFVSIAGMNVTDELFENGITEATIDFPPSEDIFQYANECFYLEDNDTNQYVRRIGFRYELTDLLEEATPLYLMATSLGGFILHGPDARNLATNDLGSFISPSRIANNRSEWEVSSGFEDGPLRVTNSFSGFDLSTDAVGRLLEVDSQEARRWKFRPATGCSAFPDVEINVQGDPQPSPDVGLPVRGFIDAHSHVTSYEFFGGRLHCGKPWDRYGAIDALKDCPDHFATGEYAIMENFLTNGTRTGFHLDQGWPNFDPPDVQGWPRYDSLTHEGMYWKAVERAWKGGLRLMVANLTENKPLCELYWLGDNNCEDRISIANQAEKIRELEAYIDAQYKGPGNGFFRIVESPSEARAVIDEGKLAVVLGVETTRPLSCDFDDTTLGQCGSDSLQSLLTELWDLGVRSMFPVYSIDNVFGGTSMAADFQGLLNNVANQRDTGAYWKVDTCPGGETDITPPSPGGGQNLFDDPNQLAIESQMSNQFSTVEPPVYPTGPVCNVRGLTEQGELLINSMADMGMIIETGNMSAIMRDQVLTILEDREYSGVTTSIGIGGSISRARVQALGGLVAPHASDTLDFIDVWQEASGTQSQDFLWGMGFSPDTNGLRRQPAPRINAEVDMPVIYPFDNFDGTAVIEQNVWGSRLWDINQDGVAHYGMYPDWIKDLENIAGPDIVDDLANGAEAYLQMWERAYSAGQ